MNIRKYLFVIPALAAFMVFGTGCEVGVNPLLFDGTPVEAVFKINTSGTFYSD